jgi:regulator of sirC expression with transglutaminase-like and TPR domain
MLDSLLDQLARDPAADVDVAAVALWLAADAYPDLDPSVYLRRLDALADRARPLLVGDLPEQVAGLSHFLFDDEGFRGNAADYYDPRNSYLNDVLDRKAGIPITLSVVAMAIGRRAGLEVVGAGLPGHFIAKAVRGGQEVLFDPFHGGQILTPAECEELIETVTGRPLAVTPELLAATPPGHIVARMLNNLRGIYAAREAWGRVVRVLGRLRQLDARDPDLRRDLGAALVRGGKPGPAIDHLKAYLAAAPDAADADEVKRILARAVADVARWN